MLPNQGNGTPFRLSIKHTAPKMNKANNKTTKVIWQHDSSHFETSLVIRKGFSMSSKSFRLEFNGVVSSWPPWNRLAFLAAEWEFIGSLGLLAFLAAELMAGAAKGISSFLMK